jgi:ABC-type multidrug transport system ATPase subunit
MNLLEVRDLTVSFGKSFSVGPASFAMDRGVLHIKGPNGGGKTTLMRAMSGGLFPAQGRVVVNNKDVHKSVEARRNIAFVSAIPELPDFLTVQEAYQFAAAIRRAPAWEGRSFCEQLNLDRNLPLSSASAGQRQKAELICGLAGDPAVLLLDETFAHLDHASVEQLNAWIREWATTRLVVFTHHGEPPIAPNATLSVEKMSVVFESLASRPEAE